MGEGLAVLYPGPEPFENPVTSTDPLPETHAWVCACARAHTRSHKQVHGHIQVCLDQTHVYMCACVRPRAYACTCHATGNVRRFLIPCLIRPFYLTRVETEACRETCPRLARQRDPNWTNLEPLATPALESSVSQHCAGCQGKPHRILESERLGREAGILSTSCLVSWPPCGAFLEALWHRMRRGLPWRLGWVE